MFTELEIMLMGISVFVGFIAIDLYGRLDICKSERDTYYEMYTYYKRECMKLTYLEKLKKEIKVRRID